MSKRPNIPEDHKEHTDHIQDHEHIKPWVNQVVCMNCGYEYLTEKQKQGSSTVTANMGICYKCGEHKLVLDTRHYNYLHKPEEDNWHPDSEL